MNGFFSQRRRRWISLGFVLAALAAPQAQAATGGQGVNGSRSTQLRADDRLGPKYVPVATDSPAAITIVRPAGFDVGDALIGAGVAAVATALLAGLFVLSGRFKGHRSTSGVSVRPEPRA